MKKSTCSNRTAKCFTLTLQKVSNFLLKINFATDGRNFLVHGAASSNTYAIYGQAQEKAITDILSTSMAQLGEKEVNYLQSTLGGGEAETGAEDDLPELVEQLELKESGLEEIN